MANPKVMLLRDALDKYYSTVSKHKKGHLQEFYRIKVIKRSVLANQPMNAITSVDIAEYRDHRLATISMHTGRCISANTVRLEMALLSALYNLARVEWGTCSDNPVECVRKPPSGSGRSRRLTPSEESSLTKYFERKNIELLAIFQIALETAMRQGEILSLRWENIDINLGVAQLPVTKNGSSRDVPLSAKARHIFKTLAKNNNDRVFDYTSNGFKSAWRKATQILGITDLHFHDLRHEAISRMFELGSLNVMEVASISGHKSMNMLKRYTHLRASQLVSKLDVRNRQARKFGSFFIAYPADVERTGEVVTLRFSDLNDLKITASTQEDALKHASIELLRFQALAARNGDRLPPPGHIDVNSLNRILVNPLP